MDPGWFQVRATAPITRPMSTPRTSGLARPLDALGTLACIHPSAIHLSVPEGTPCLVECSLRFACSCPLPAAAAVTRATAIPPMLQALEEADPAASAEAAVGAPVASAEAPASVARAASAGRGGPGGARAGGPPGTPGPPGGATAPPPPNPAQATPVRA